MAECNVCVAIYISFGICFEIVNANRFDQREKKYEILDDFETIRILTIVRMRIHKAACWK